MLENTKEAQIKYSKKRKSAIKFIKSPKKDKERPILSDISKSLKLEGESIKRIYLPL